MSYFQGVSPSGGQVVSSSRPTITVTAYIDESDIPVRYGYTLTKGATTYTAYADFETVFQGYAGPTSYSFQPPADLEDGVWTLSGYTMYGTGGGAYSHMSGSPSANTTFTVASIPTTTLTSPVDNYVDTWVGTNHSLPVYWQFNSSSANDYQSAYQVIVRRSDNQTVVYDSGKVASGSKSATAVIPAAQKDVQLEWSVRTWNKSDVATAYPAFRKVLLGTPPTSTISAPTQNQVLNGAFADVTTSATTSGGRTVKRVDVALWQGTQRLWSKTVQGTWASGATIQVQDFNYLIPQSSASYQYRVTHTDSLGFTSTMVTRDFTVVYTQPSAPSVTPTISNANYDTGGYMRLRWGSESLDSTFYAWIIERTETALDPNTGVPDNVWSDWHEIGRVYDLAISYEFRDYLAPSNHYCAYRIRQVAYRFGQQLVGTATSVAVGANAIGTSYWLIAGTSKGTMKKVINLWTNPSFEVDTAGITAGGVTATSSTDWAAVGTKSLKLVPTGTTNDNFITLGGDTGAMRLGMQAGKTYTVSATARIASAFAGASINVGQARRICFFYRVGTGSYQQVQSPALANTAGANSRLTVTLAIPAGTTEAFIRLYNGSTSATDIIYYDAVTVFEGTSEPAYVDGAQPGCVWNGTAHNSTSSTYVTDDASVETNVLPMRLYNVTGDQFTDETVQNEFNLIGRGRYSEKGDHLGVKGSLNAQIRDGQGKTARQKKLDLLRYKDTYSKAALRNPFGDVYNVSIGDIGVTRIPGTGLSEFVDVTIPYTEVVA